MSLLSLLDPAVHLVYAAVTGLAATLPDVAPPGNRIAVALVLVTWVVRAALLPLAVSAARARNASAGVAEEVARLRRRHADDPQRLAAEVRRVYAEAGVGPVGGLLPTLAQVPVLSTMYRLVTLPVVAGHPNAVLGSVVLGVPLAEHWPGLIAAAGVFSGTTVVLVAMLTLLTALAWVTSRQLATTGNDPGTPGPVRLMRLLPFATVGFAVVVPPAVGLYLLASTAWTVTERALLAG